MNKNFDEILRTVPSRRSRSKLEPYRPLVEELRRRGLSFRAIAAVLADQCAVQSSHVAIRELLQRRSVQTAIAREAPATSSGPLKRLPAAVPQEDFQFEPNEPLRLMPSILRRGQAT